MDHLHGSRKVQKLTRDKPSVSRTPASSESRNTTPQRSASSRPETPRAGSGTPQTLGQLKATAILQERLFDLWKLSSLFSIRAAASGLSAPVKGQMTKKYKAQLKVCEDKEWIPAGKHDTVSSQSLNCGLSAADLSDAFFLGLGVRNWTRDTLPKSGAQVLEFMQGILRQENATVEASIAAAQAAETPSRPQRSEKRPANYLVDDVPPSKRPRQSDQGPTPDTEPASPSPQRVPLSKERVSASDDEDDEEYEPEASDVEKEDDEEEGEDEPEASDVAREDDEEEGEDRPEASNVAREDDEEEGEDRPEASDMEVDEDDEDEFAEDE